MKLILARHGETDWNKQRRMQGISDTELNETGRMQVEALAQSLKDKNVKAIYSSPLKRALDTAYAIGYHHQIDVVPIDNLKELDVGEMDGLSYEEMSSQYSDFLKEWIKDCTAVRLPGGCTMHETQDKAWTAIQDILQNHHAGAIKTEEHEEGLVVVVAHFFPILSIICKALGIHLSQFRRLKVDLASTSTLDFNQSETVLVSLNDTCHLK